MRKLLFTIPVIAAVAAILSACNNDDSTWDTYSEWREANLDWYEDQKFLIGDDGSAVYTELSPAWDASASILIRYLNDRSKTEGNLTPLYTSTVDVKYIGRLYDGTPFDSSYTNTASYGDSLFRTTPGSLIQGWSIALLNMRVGDSVRIVVPYDLGYGTSGSGSAIPPYSMLEFDVKLVDIPFYEVKN